MAIFRRKIYNNFKINAYEKNYYIFSIALWRA